MLEVFTVKYQNISLVNFNYVLKQHIEIQLLNDLYKYNLLPIDFKNKDTRKIIIHHVINETCMYLLKNSHKTSKQVIVLSPLYKHSELKKYIDENEWNILLKKIFNKLMNYACVKTFECNTSYVKFVHEIYKNTSIGTENLNKIKSLIQIQSCKKNINFEKIIKFVQKNDLTYLNKKFFSKIVSRKLIL